MHRLSGADPRPGIGRHPDCGTDQDAGSGGIGPSGSSTVVGAGTRSARPDGDPAAIRSAVSVDNDHSHLNTAVDTNLAVDTARERPRTRGADGATLPSNLSGTKDRAEEATLER
ncbi:hypothetical protein GCM10027570_09830 [Streptomonospora sediminis]